MGIARWRAGRVGIPGFAVLPAAIGAGLAQYAVTSWMWHHGLVTGSPVVLALLLGLVVLSGTRAFQSAVGHGRIDTWPVTRLAVAFVLFAALTWTAGWSFILPTTAIFVGVVQIRRSGSRLWLPALLIVGGFTLVGQIGVELGWVSSITRPLVSHVGACAVHCGPRTTWPGSRVTSSAPSSPRCTTTPRSWP